MIIGVCIEHLQHIDILHLKQKTFKTQSQSHGNILQPIAAHFALTNGKPPSSCFWKGASCQASDIKTVMTDMGVCYMFNSSDMFIEQSGKRVCCVCVCVHA